MTRMILGVLAGLAIAAGSLLAWRFWQIDGVVAIVFALVGAGIVVGALSHISDDTDYEEGGLEKDDDE